VIALSNPVGAAASLQNDVPNDGKTRVWDLCAELY
jgi:hypothetical protein